MSRWKAASLHLALSVATIGITLAAILVLWYPPGLRSAIGVLSMLALIAAVAAVTGPLLTLVVFKANKPSLRFDLVVVVLLQIAALGYGLFTLATTRPVFLVASSGRLDLVQANEVDRESLARAEPIYRTLSWTGPVLVGARLPVEPQKRVEALREIRAGRTLPTQPHHYVTFEVAAPEMLIGAQPLDELVPLLDEPEKKRVRAALSRMDNDSQRYIPVQTGRGQAIALIHSTGTLGPLVAIDPTLVRERAQAQR